MFPLSDRSIAILGLILTATGLFFSFIGLYSIQTGMTIGAVLIVIGIVFILFKNYNNALKKIKEMDTISTDLEFMKTRLSEFEETNKQFESMLKLASEGMCLTRDQVTVTYKCESTQNEPIYIFNFEKHFTITSDDEPTRFKAQFYANKQLTSRKLTQDFYSKEENIIKWEDLKVKASLSYKNSTESNFTNIQELVISNILQSGYYIPFNIIFKSRQGQNIVLKKGMDVILKYSYQVKSRLWGTYLNRTLGFFSVDPVVIIKYNNKFDNELKYNVSNLSYFNGIPSVYGNYTDDISDDGYEKKITILIRSEPFGKYRVDWGAKECFNLHEEDTPYGADDLGVTCR